MAWSTAFVVIVAILVADNLLNNFMARWQKGSLIQTAATKALDALDPDQE